VIGDYWRVTKPGIVGGNLVSVMAGFFLAGGASASLLPVLVGMALVIASACVLNNCLDRDLDRRMRRTRNRALARGAMSPRAACIYAAVLGLAGFGLLAARTNGLALGMALAGFVVYVVVYTLIMKRRSPWATWVGSLAGAAPPLAGYGAASGRFDAGAVVLLLVFGLWQIPHFYAIAVSRLDDYTAAGIPVLPAVRGVDATQRQIITSILAFTAAAAMLGIAGYAGSGYLVVAVTCGLVWLALACCGRAVAGDRAWARRVFVASLVTLCAVSAMMAIDAPAHPAPVVLSMAQVG